MKKYLLLGILSLGLSTQFAHADCAENTNDSNAAVASTYHTNLEARHKDNENHFVNLRNYRHVEMNNSIDSNDTFVFPMGE